MERAISSGTRLYYGALALLAAMYLVGFWGMQWPLASEWVRSFTPFPSFAALTPFNLLVSAGLLLAFHRNWDARTHLFVIGSALSGFLVEVLGVQTGAIFGTYWYGGTLGTKVWDVPLVIGLNWMVLTYCAGSMVAALKAPWWAKAAVAASIMTALDVLIEPVAMKYDFWQWQGNEVPLQNYMAWWAVAWLLSAFFLKMVRARENSLAMPLLAAQALFFALLGAMLP